MALPRWLIVVFALAGWVGNSVAQDWIPLEVGNRWEFTSLIEPPFSFPVTVGAGSIWVVETVDVDGQAFFRLGGGIVHSDTVRFNASGQLTGLVAGVEQVLLDFTVPDGGTYAYVDHLGQGDLDTMEVAVTRGGMVRTPVGGFQDPITFSARSFRVSDSGWSVTLVAGVGPIMRYNGMGEEGKLSRAVLSGTVAYGSRLQTTVWTDKSEYAYGEPIRITLRLDNTEAVHNEISTAGNSPDYRIGSVVLGHAALIPEVYPIFFRPGSWREWSWTHDPTVLGLSGSDNLHTVSAAYGLAVGTTTFGAPAFVGGWLRARFSEAVPVSEIDIIRSAIQPTVIESELRNGRLTETWAIQGRTLEDVMMEYDGVPGLGLDTFRYMHNLDVRTVGVENESGPFPVVLHAFPNPATNGITIAFGAGAFELRVFDILGRTVATGVASTGRISVDTRHFAHGVYLFRAESPSQSGSGKFVVGR
ncbi:MAG: hypothetical protein ACI80V_003446 [Rhodothermales bacterium]|jgi:hypothetical protein